MREHKFRARSKITADWVYGDLVRLYGTDFASRWGVRRYIAVLDETNRPIYYEAVAGTICEGTGIMDVRGQEIFEGDILRVRGIRDVPDGSLLAVRWKRAGFVLSGKDFSVLFPEENAHAVLEVAGDVSGGGKLAECLAARPVWGKNNYN